MTSVLVFLVYGIVVLVFVVLSGVILYHLIRFGFFGDATKFMIIIFAVVGILLIVMSAIYVFSTPWTQDLQLNPTSLPGSPSFHEPIFGNQ